jgi:hypothetical protein
VVPAEAAVTPTAPRASTIGVAISAAICDWSAFHFPLSVPAIEPHAGRTPRRRCRQKDDFGVTTMRRWPSNCPRETP